jgi:hypothetical protein
MQFVDSRDAVPLALARSFDNGCTCQALNVEAANAPPNQPAADWWVIVHGLRCAYYEAMSKLQELDE